MDGRSEKINVGFTLTFSCVVPLRVALAYDFISFQLHWFLFYKFPIALAFVTLAFGCIGIFWKLGKINFVLAYHIQT